MVGPGGFFRDVGCVQGLGLTLAVFERDLLANPQGGAGATLEGPGMNQAGLDAPHPSQDPRESQN